MSLRVPGELSGGSLWSCGLSSHPCAALEGREAAVKFPERPGCFLWFSITQQPWYFFALWVGGGLSLAWLPQHASLLPKMYMSLSPQNLLLHQQG